MKERDNEIYRLAHFKNGELPSSYYSTIIFQSDDMQGCIVKIISVMKIIAKSKFGKWPDDQYWKNVLPQWLLNTFRTYSPEELSEIMSNKSQWAALDWTFGSWIDRIKDRCWEWWSCSVKESTVTIYILVDGEPCSVNSLRHLIDAANGRIVSGK